MKKTSLIEALVVIFPLGLMVMGIGSLFLYEKRRLDQQEERLHYVDDIG